MSQSPSDRLAAELLADRRHKEELEKWEREQAARERDRDQARERRTARRGAQPVEISHDDETNIQPVRKPDGGFTVLKAELTPEEERAKNFVRYWS
jgi:hypothetical protein